MSITYCIEEFKSSNSHSDETTIKGWIVAPIVINKLILLCPGQGCISIEINQIRPDVVSAFGNTTLTDRLGFNAKLPLPIRFYQVEVILQGDPENHIPRDLITKLDLLQNTPQRIIEGQEGYQFLALEDKVKRVLDTKPGLTLRLDIINKCNLRCIMCHYSDASYARRKTKKVTLEEFKDFFDSLAPMVKDVMLSCSDEPLLSPDFLKILEHISLNFPHVEIEFCTNAMLLNEAVRRGIVQHGVTYLMCSLDAATKTTLESIRIGSNFERIVANILALKELKLLSGSAYPRIISNFVMMEQNIHEAPTFVEMCFEMGIEEIDFRHVVPGDYWNDPSQFLQNHPEKFNYYREKLLSAANSRGIRIHIPDALEDSFRYENSDPDVTLEDFHAVRPDITYNKDPVIAKKYAEHFLPRNILWTSADIFGQTYCTRPFSEISIFNQETIRPCPYHKVTLGKQSDGKSLKEVFFGESFRNLRKNMYRPEGDINCQGCPNKGSYFGK